MLFSIQTKESYEDTKVLVAAKIFRLVNKFLKYPDNRCLVSSVLNAKENASDNELLKLLKTQMYNKIIIILILYTILCCL